MASLVKCINSNAQDRLSQGDIYENVDYFESWDNFYSENTKISIINYPLIVVLTQDCDLQSDKKQREIKPPGSQILKSVLVAPLYNFEHFISGKHLEDLGITSCSISRNSTGAKNIIKNSDPRYHYFEFEDGIRIPPVVMDFKHYFSLSVDYLYRIKDENHVGRLAELFRERMSQRFANYLSRIGLPNI